MPRNFCGFVDLENQTNHERAVQMANKLNINLLYQPSYSELSKSHFVGLYSDRFPVPALSSFMSEMQEKYNITSFSMLIRLPELYKKLGIDSGAYYMSDEEIILRGFLKWGEQVVHHLEGDWAFAIWDSAKEELFMARAAHGDGAIFYHHSGSKFFFSTLLTGLVDIEGIPKEIDKEKLFMECFSASGFQSRTLYKNIHFLLPGHFMTFSKNQLRLTQFWQPMALPKLRFKRDEDYFEAFYETYERAVHDRLIKSDHWGFAISGGLDSAATMSLASAYFKKKNQTAEAMCFVPTYRNDEERNSEMREGDESHIAQAIADYNGNVNLSLVTKDVPWWDFMTTYTKDFGTPAHMAGVYFADALADAASKKNMDKVIMGQAGNQGLSFEGVPSYVSHKQLINDLREGLYERLDKVDLTQLLLKSIYGSGKRSLKERLGIQKKVVAEIVDKNTLLSQDFVKSINGYDLLAEHRWGKDKQLTPGQFKFNKRLKPAKHCRQGLWNQLGTRYDIAFVDPCTDKRLLELAVTLPNHIFNRNGTEKFIFKEAFKAIIPPRVMNYKKKGINLSDLANRYKSDMEQMKALIESKQNDTLYNEVMDANKVKDFCKKLDQHTEPSTAFTKELYNKSPSLFHGLLT